LCYHYSTYMEAFSIYLHIPFCVQRCHYCDFNTVAGIEFMIPDYVKALCKEIELLGEASPSLIPVRSIFFGGGTPSLLDIADIQTMLGKIQEYFHILPNVEISIEANPGTLSSAYLSDLLLAGVNRLSIGMQSAIDEELQQLGRIHTLTDVINAVKWARLAGFNNINLDLIYGTPGQTVDSWRNSLDVALDMQPEHLSLYALTLDENVPLSKMIRDGKVLDLDDDLMAEMYEIAGKVLADHEFEQYEISNWAKGDVENGRYYCRHNLQYWHYLPYLGLGAGAHGFAAGIRTENIVSIPKYIDCCEKAETSYFPQGPACENELRIDLWEQIQEYLMVGLRLVKEGVSLDQFYGRFGYPLLGLFPGKVEKLVNQGLLEFNGKTIRLSTRGRILGNQIFMQFVGNQKPEIMGSNSR